jgi:vitamin B12 transporter
LYDGFAGNIDLKPESNKTFEAGFDVSYQDWVQFDAVYFNRKEEDAIIYDNSTFKYANGSSDANGFEVNTKITPLSFLAFNASYTYINKDNFEDFNDYIPENKFVASIDYTGLENAFFNLTFRNVGERTIFDRYGSFGTAGEDIVLESYKVLDFMTNYKVLGDTVTFFGAVTNFLNEDYDDIYGYSTRGRNFKVGVRFQF